MKKIKCVFWCIFEILIGLGFYDIFLWLNEKSYYMAFFFYLKGTRNCYFQFSVCIYSVGKNNRDTNYFLLTFFGTHALIIPTITEFYYLFTFFSFIAFLFLLAEISKKYLIRLKKIIGTYFNNFKNIFERKLIANC